jgi:mono/diheme cytochrome c family protein
LKKHFLILAVVLVLTGCVGISENLEKPINAGSGPGMMGSGMGPGSGMMNRHRMQVPDEYAGLTNPAPADQASLERGEEIYTTQCVTCHGDYGNGDGPGGAALDPAPAPIAHTSQMLSDAYLFWRITEGGISFETGMIPFKDILDEQARWDVINYVRALGRGQVQPGEQMGGVPFDPAEEQAQRAGMLVQAIEQGIISQPEADNFDTVHTQMKAYLESDSVSGMDTNTQADALPQIMAAMISANLISREQADLFIAVHDRLVEAGLMQ